MPKQKQNIPKLRFSEFSEAWAEKPLGEMFKIGSGRDYKHLGKGNIPVYGTGGYMTSVDDFLYDGESVCIGRKGTIDKPVFLKGKFWTVDTLFYTHSFNETIPSFIYLLFQKIDWKKHNEASGVPSLSKTTIEKIKSIIPKLPEQTKIAEFLTAIDDRFSKLQEKKSLLEKYKQGAMQQIFSQQLRFTDDNNKPYPAWEEKPLGKLCDISKGEQLNKSELTLTGEYPALNGGVLPSGYTTVYNTEKDTITISEGGNSCGYINFVKQRFWCGGHCYALVDLNKSIDNLYLYQILKFNQAAIMALRVGSGLPNIQKKDLNNFKIKLPKSPDEQQKIASFLTAIDQKTEAVTTQITQAQTFKKGLLQQMFV